MKALKIIGIVVIILIGLVIGFAIAKDIKPIGMHSEMRLTDGIAINGYDATTYYSSELVKGYPKFTLNWNGAKWQFASAENLASFKANPEKFAPQYGGHCTFAISTGFAAPTEPKFFRVHNNKIYLFSNEDVLAEFEVNPEEMIANCDSKWEE